MCCQSWQKPLLSCQKIGPPSVGKYALIYPRRWNSTSDTSAGVSGSLRRETWRPLYFGPHDYHAFVDVGQRLWCKTPWCFLMPLFLTNKSWLELSLFVCWFSLISLQSQDVKFINPLVQHSKWLQARKAMIWLLCWTTRQIYSLIRCPANSTWKCLANQMHEDVCESFGITIGTWKVCPKPLIRGMITTKRGPSSVSLVMIVLPNVL